MDQETLQHTENWAVATFGAAELGDAQNGPHGLGRARLGNTSPEGQEPLEWILLTTIPILSPCDAWEMVKWDGWRWILEDFPKALKTGCRMEKHCLQSVQAQWNLLAVLTPSALRLLEIRQVAQQASETPATDVVSKASGPSGEPLARSGLARS